ncbi:MAG: hypothetical protein KJ593_07425 [Candidatus Omnitrophica bacterium]|nr:hypothetical protein [Candidatus Omnitrophota bacterium]
MNGKKIKKAVSLSLGLLVAFFAHKWFEQAYTQPTDWGKWVMIAVTLIILMVIVYFNVDKDGNF